MRYFCFTLCFILVSAHVQAQFSETFTDTNLTDNPVWIGDRTSWKCADKKLKSAHTIPNSRFYLSTHSAAVQNTEWLLSIDLQFNTSGANYVQVWLASDSANPEKAQRGYFVRLGGTKDEISLYKRNLGKDTLLIDGVDGILNKTSSSIQLHISCSNTFEWKLQRTISGEKQFREGIVKDSSMRSSSWFGLQVVQSVSSFFGKHAFSEIFVHAILTDTTPPKVLQKELINKKLLLAFDEPVSPEWLALPGCVKLYTTTGEEIKIGNAEHDALLLTNYSFSLPLLATGLYVLKVQGARDEAGNTADTVSFKLLYLPPVLAGYRQIRISELMPDPVPSAGLPEEEYVELENASEVAFNLKEYVLSDNTTFSRLPSFVLQPGSRVLLVKAADSVLFRPFGPLLALPEWPSLNNSADILWLKNPEGVLVDKVSYVAGWYHNSSKDDGGYSLELKDPSQKCLEEQNWSASSASEGGTPGKSNSIRQIVKDTVPPRFRSLEILEGNRLSISFTKPIDTTITNLATLHLNNDLPIASMKTFSDSADRFHVYLSGDLKKNTEYTLLIDRLKDCSGNESIRQHYVFMLTQTAEKGEVLLNELLFNPLTGGPDFAELFNASPRTVDLKNWSLATIKGDTISNRKPIATSQLLLKPGEYLAFTTDKTGLLNHYPKSSSGYILEIPALPPFNDNEGTVVLLDPDMSEMERFEYNEAMHSPLLAKKEGVSLEKINAALPANVLSNWHSAAREAGYATPGYLNSQHIELGLDKDFITISPLLITPNGDGDNDFMIISIKSGQFGSLRSVVIFDVMGRKVKQLQAAGLSGTDSQLQWDGTGEGNTLLPLGHYILWIEAIDSGGTTRHHKEKMVIGTRF